MLGLGLRVLKWLALVGAIGAALWLAFAYVLDPRGMAQYEEMELRLDRLHNQNLAVQRENRRLMREIEAIQHDERYLDELSRHNLNLIRDGEVVYMFPE